MLRLPEISIAAHLHSTLEKILALAAIRQLIKSRRVVSFECEQVPPIELSFHRMPALETFCEDEAENRRQLRQPCYSSWPIWPVLW